MFPSDPACRACPLHTFAKCIGTPSLPFSSPVHAPYTTQAGRGKPTLICLGQEPGREEDVANQPFVGKSGQWLRNIYLVPNSFPSLAHIYFVNTARCYKPHNIKVSPATYSTCFNLHFPSDFERIAALSVPPLYVLCLGGPAFSTLLRYLNVKGKRTLERDGFASQNAAHTLHGTPIRLFSTYHPAYCMRSPPALLTVADHLSTLRACIAGALPPVSKPNFVAPFSPITVAGAPPREASPVVG
jgi:uracil-DNA glycosylase family 4